MASRGGRKGRGSVAGKGPRINDPQTISLMRLVDRSSYPEVEALARQILSRSPGHSLAQKALSFALVGMCRPDEAVPVLDLAIRQSSADGELYNNRGIALIQLHRWDEAFEDFERARGLMPDDPELLKNIALALGHMHRWEEAIPILLEAIEKHPGDFVEAISMLADFLFNCKRLDEAWTCYRELYNGDNADLNALYQLVAVGLHKCDWRSLSDHLVTLREKSDGFAVDVKGEPLIGLCFPGMTPEEHLRIARHRATSTLRAVLPYRNEVTRVAEPGPRSRRLKIGFISGDLRGHAVGQLLTELVERHHRERYEFLAYSTTKGDGSNARKRLEAAFERFTDVGDLVAAKAATRIRDDEVDILVDLCGWTSYHRQEALAIRCAPVQVAWLGYPGTLGLPELADYIIGDPVVTPISNSGHFAERIAQLPNCYLPYDTTRLPGQAATREAQGLPEDAFVFCSFNVVQKYNPPLFDLWCRILSQSPGSVLWLNRPSEAIAAALRGELEARGIAPERLLFASHAPEFADHLARVKLADLALDPFPYNSHSTGMDMLWAGVPLLSLRGGNFAGRVGASMLHVAQLDELVVDSPERYCELALSLYRDRATLNAIRDKVERARTASKLFDMGAFARDLESVFERIWQNHCRGLRQALPAGVC